MIEDWNVYDNFSKWEFDCSHTGENDMQPSFMDKLQELRERCGFAFHISSGYRSVHHPIEASKNQPGNHSHGIAADILITDGKSAYTLIKHAMDVGFTGIGVSQDYRGNRSFIHLDTEVSNRRPNLYSY